MTTTNNLHVYASNSSNTMDTTDDYTSYEAGAKAGDVLSSKTMNTAVRTSTLIAKALIDAVTKNQSTSEISHKTSSDTIKQFIQDGITQTKVNNASQADKATRSTNVDNINNNDTNDNANVKFSIGDKSYEKTVNNIAHATTTTNVDNITNNDSGDNANIKFAIGDKSYEKTVNNIAQADKAKSVYLYNSSNSEIECTSNIALPQELWNAGSGWYHMSVYSSELVNTKSRIDCGLVYIDLDMYNKRTEFALSKPYISKESITSFIAVELYISTASTLKSQSVFEVSYITVTRNIIDQTYITNLTNNIVDRAAKVYLRKVNFINKAA